MSTTFTGGQWPPVSAPDDESVPVPEVRRDDRPPAPGPVDAGADWLREEIKRRMAARPSVPGGRHAKREDADGPASGQWAPGDGSRAATGARPVVTVTQAARIGGRAPSAGEGNDGRSGDRLDRGGPVLWSRAATAAEPSARPPATPSREPGGESDQRHTDPVRDTPPPQQNLDPATTEPPKRVRVVLAERRGVAKPVRTIKEVQEDTAVGKLLRSNLIGSQLSVALRFAALAGLVLGLLPLLFALVPEIGRIEVLGMRLPWLILGILIYPFLFGMGWWHTRTAERVEQNFADHIQD